MLVIVMIWVKHELCVSGAGTSNLPPTSMPHTIMNMFQNSQHSTQSMEWNKLVRCHLYLQILCLNISPVLHLILKNGGMMCHSFVTCYKYLPA